MRAYDIPVTKEREVGDEETLLEAIRDIGFPLVLKGSGADLSHKTERGLVRVDIRNVGLSLVRDLNHTRGYNVHVVRHLFLPPSAWSLA